MMKFGKEDQIKEYLGRTKDGKVLKLNLMHTLGPTPGPNPGPTLGPTPGPTTRPTLGPTPGPTLGRTPGQTLGQTLGQPFCNFSIFIAMNAQPFTYVN